VAFIVSKQIDIRPWWDETTDELWHECGFSARPTYMTTWRRLRELETVADEFLTAASVVIKRCKEHDSRVLAHVHFDYTEQETHAGLTHDCQEGDVCSYAKAVKDGKVWGKSKRPVRASTSIAREERHERSEEDPETAAALEKKNAPSKTQIDGDIKRVRINGCWYRTRDLEAGIRAYTGKRGCKKFWHGYYSGKAVCHFTGTAIPSVDSASRNECHLFPELLDRVGAMAGQFPETAIADRGMSISSCFEHATSKGVAPVFPWRKWGDGKRHDHETHDRHGMKRCKHCGGPMEQTRFSTNNSSPRLWFRCTAPFTAECEKEQTISCKEDWRSLVPLAETEALYQELRLSHQTYEAVHGYWRQRFKVGGDSLANRPKVIGLAWHRLRANVACLMDWLLVAANCGWLGSKPSKRLRGKRKFKSRGEHEAARLSDLRERWGLENPYGRIAKLLGLGDELPPSEKPPPKTAAAAPA
jgi:hypothetical protein